MSEQQSFTEERISIDQARDEINSAFHQAASQIGELIPFPSNVRPALMGAPEHVSMCGAIYPLVDLEPVPSKS